MRSNATGVATSDIIDSGVNLRRSTFARMSERKFTRGLGKPGMAAQLRETVSQVVRESTVQVRLFISSAYRPNSSTCLAGMLLEV